MKLYVGDNNFGPRATAPEMPDFLIQWWAKLNFLLPLKMLWGFSHRKRSLSASYIPNWS